LQCSMGAETWQKRALAGADGRKLDNTHGQSECSFPKRCANMDATEVVCCQLKRHAR
jgi:hypothetical protein